MRLFVLLLEGKANLKDTGAIALPSDDGIEQAPADLKERLLAIESVDLSGLKNLGGKWACFKFEYMFGMCSRLCVCVCVVGCALPISHSPPNQHGPLKLIASSIIGRACTWISFVTCGEIQRTHLVPV